MMYLCQLQLSCSGSRVVVVAAVLTVSLAMTTKLVVELDMLLLTVVVVLE